jgi:acyl-homoserine-lactone acylase
VLPFTEQQITADPQYQAQTIHEQDEKVGKIAAQ